MKKYQLENLLEATLDELQEEHDTYAKDLEGRVKESFEDFMEDYVAPEELNTIKIDCKLDMAIPKESLQENLQLLIDLHGVQEVSTLVEKVLEVGFDNTLKLL